MKAASKTVNVSSFGFSRISRPSNTSLTRQLVLAVDPGLADLFLIVAKVSTQTGTYVEKIWFV